MKIGLITFYKDNFGSILQCYATKHVLEEMGYECDVIYEIVKEPCVIKHKLLGLCRLINGYIFDREYVEKRRLAINAPQPLSRKTWDMMDEFVECEFTPKGYSFKELCVLEKDYDVFIVGSDQVWNAFNPIAKSYFLKFASDKKKIAFAISLGTDMPTGKFLKIIKKGIKGFDNISVREESGVEMMKKITNVSIQRIADPTMLINADIWRMFYKGVEVKHNYILVHFLNEPNNIAVEIINKICKQRKLNAVCIGYRYDIFDKYLWKYLDCNPREYVGYIDSAELVCTDSFHTTLFSINLGKEFYVFDRQYLHRHPQTSRINNLLERYGLDDRMIRDITKLPVSRVDNKAKLIDDERNKVRNYLENELNRVKGIE